MDKAGAGERSEAKVGMAYALAAFLWWGCAVFYFKAIGYVPSPEVLAHRIIWSVLFLALLMSVRGRLGEVRSILKNKRTILFLSMTTVLLATNWYIFIWAIANGRVLQTSLGYFINPLVNVLLGFVFLRERLNRTQAASVALAALAVLILALNASSPPYIALALAFSFGLYGLLRKKCGVAGVPGLAVETLLLLPAAAAYLFYLGGAGRLIFTRLDRVTDILLLSAGPVTSIPLIWFVNGVRRLRYSTVGFIQYLMPTMTFLIAVFIFREPFGRVQLAGFILVWIALAIFVTDAAVKKPKG